MPGRARVQCSVAVALLVLAACRPPLTLTPCDANRPCPTGFLCDPARGYCVTPPSAAGDASKRDRAPGEAATPDQVGVDHGAVDAWMGDRATTDLPAEDRALADLVAPDAPAQDTAASDVAASDLVATDLATPDQVSTLDAPTSDGGNTLSEGGLLEAAVTSDGPAGLLDRQVVEASTDLDATVIADAPVTGADGAVADASISTDASSALDVAPAADGSNGTTDSSTAPDKVSVSEGGNSGDATSCAGLPYDCPGVGCVDLAHDVSNCGTCGTSCFGSHCGWPDLLYDQGQCSCEANFCPQTGGGGGTFCNADQKCVCPWYDDKPCPVGYTCSLRTGQEMQGGCCIQEGIFTRCLAGAVSPCSWTAGASECWLDNQVTCCLATQACAHDGTLTCADLE